MTMFYQVRILVSECQDATWLAANNGVSVFDERVHRSNIELRVGPRFLSKALRNHRSPAASALVGETNFIACGFEKLRSCFADIGVVVVDEGVVEKNDLSGGHTGSVADFGLRPVGEP